MRYTNRPPEIKVLMVQDAAARWHIESTDGKIIRDNLTMSSASEAEEFVRSYVSSFRCWTYELKLKGE